MAKEMSDIGYICKGICNLSTLPTRYYKSGELVRFYSVREFAADPFTPFEKEVLGGKQKTKLFATADFFYYGILVHGEYIIVIGPVSTLKQEKQKFHDLAFALELPPNKVAGFVESMDSLMPYPLPTFSQMLCLMNYALNGNKLTIDEISGTLQKQDEISKMFAEEDATAYEYPDFDDMSEHNTFAYERTMLEFVRLGDIASLKTMFAETAPGRGGKVARETIRQQKNTFIIAATLVSRAAIEGGLSVNEAFSISDAYIQKCELLSSNVDLMSLSYHMVMDYAQKVERICGFDDSDHILADVKNYIRSHLADAIKITEVASSLCISRSYLSERFKEITGNTISDFIVDEKIGEAKRLLKYTDKSILFIGNYLGFSSQSHFQRVFKERTSKTPNDFRRECK